MATCPSPDKSTTANNRNDPPTPETEEADAPYMANGTAGTNGHADPSDFRVRAAIARFQGYPNNLQDLRKSGLTDETIAACELRVEPDPKEIARLLRWKKARGVSPCTVFPIYGPDGQPGSYCRLRPADPVKFSDGEEAKYLSPSGNCEMLCYFPPGTRGAVLQDTSQPLIITEGEKKAIAADQAGFLVPSGKTEPVLSGKAEPVGAAGVVWRAQRARVAQLGTRVKARSEGRPGVVA